MVGVQDEDAVQSALNHGVDLVLFAGVAEHHAHEVAGIRQVVLGVHVGLAHTVLVCHGNQSRHLGDQADRCNVAVLWVGDVGAVVVEGRHAAHQTGQHGHGVSIATEAAQEELHLLVDHGVLGHQLFEVGLFLLVGQLPVQQQVAGFQEVAVLGQLFDGVAAVQQLALVAIDVGDGGLAGGGREEARVIREHASLGIELADVDHIRADIALVHRHFHTGSAIAERQRCFVVSEFHFQTSFSSLPSLLGTVTGLALAHHLQHFPDFLGIELSFWFLATQEKIHQVVVCQIHQGRQASRVSPRELASVGGEELLDEQIVLNQTTAAAPPQQVALTFVEQSIRHQHQTVRRTISSLILPMAAVGFRCLGHTSTQFMMVWQRKRR